MSICESVTEWCGALHDTLMDQNDKMQDMFCEQQRDKDQFIAISVIEIALKSVGADSFESLIKVASVCTSLRDCMLNVRNKLDKRDHSE